MTMFVDTPHSLCRAGVARGDVTPPVGMYHRMWGAAAHDRSTGVHRPLLATVLVVQPTDGAAGAAVLVALDHCIIGDGDLAAIRASVAAQTSFAAEHVHITLSHTHGAGLMMRDRGGEPGGDQIGPYLDRLIAGVGQLAHDAERRLRPARVLYATGRCGLAADRDFFDESRGRYVCGFNPEKPADDTVLVARLDDAETGATIATIVNYACHPTTLAWQNTLISPDFVGAMRDVVEQSTGGNAPCLFLQGASGELAPREQYVGDTAIADRNGRQLGHAAAAALASLPPAGAGTRLAYEGPVVSGALLGTWERQAGDDAAIHRASTCRHSSWTVHLPYRTDLPTLDQTRASREQSIADERAARERGDAAAAADQRARAEQMTRQIMRLEALPPGDTFPLRLTVLQLGDAFWAFAAGEHYSALQTRLRERFPDVPILITTITDGWQPGYLPTAETYGKGIYQETICMLAPGALERVAEELATQVAEWVSE
jgi:hypothetical protein